MSVVYFIVVIVWLSVCCFGFVFIFFFVCFDFSKCALSSIFFFLFIFRIRDVNCLRPNMKKKKSFLWFIDDEIFMVYMDFALYKKRFMAFFSRRWLFWASALNSYANCAVLIFEKVRICKLLFMGVAFRKLNLCTGFDVLLFSVWCVCARAQESFYNFSFGICLLVGVEKPIGVNPSDVCCICASANNWF